MKAKINNSLIKKLSPADKEYEVHDTDLKGFVIRVFPSGTMRYICQYQRARKINIGTVGVITPAQAREKAVEILNDFNKGIDPTAKRGSNKPKTLQEFIENEYEAWVLSHHKRGHKTLASLTRCFNQLFSKPLTDITPSILDQWRVKRLNDGISNATLNRDIGVLKSLMTKATEWGVLKENPLKNLKLFKIDRAPKVRYLSLEEETRLRQALLDREYKLKQERKSANQWREDRGYVLYPEVADDESCDHLMPMVLLSINTGLRQGELFNLNWEMVNLSERSLILSGGITKNSSSRYIPLNDEANQIIQQLYKKSDVKVGLVFPSKNNQPFNNIKRSWSSVLKTANITQFRWHDLRHHFASKLVMVGIDLNTVRELLGHSDIKMTLRYAHLAPEHKINAVKKIDWSMQGKVTC
jgi:integrase